VAVRTAAILAASALLFIAGCGRTEKPPPSAASEAPAPIVAAAPQPSAPTDTRLDAPVPAPEPKVLLRVVWLPRGRAVYRFELEQHSTNAIANAPKSAQEDLSMGMTYAVSRHHDTNVVRLDLQLLAFDIEVKVDGRALMRFDSEPGSNAPPLASLCEPFTRIAGTQLGLILAPDGSVASLTGFDEWTRRVAGERAEVAEQMIAQQFNEGFFRQMVAFGQGLPTHLVGIGDPWSYQTELNAGALGKLTINSTLVLRRWEKHEDRKLAVVETAGTIKGAGQPETPLPGAIWFEQGAVAGVSWFDLEAGRLVESTVTQQMHLAGITANAVAGPQSASRFTSQMGQRVTVKLVESEEKAR
jgi:hypothetical protein